MQYSIQDNPKQVRETLCIAQTCIGNSELNDEAKRGHIRRLQRLINACDVLRPLGPDGKHGDLHTDRCGCFDIPDMED